MTKIKLCGLSRPCEIEWANALGPDYIGFVFAPRSKRFVSPSRAAELKKLLAPGIKAVGVFVDESPERVATLLNEGVIDLAQLHGHEDESYIAALRKLTDRPIVQAFRVKAAEDATRAQGSSADLVLLDSGAGTGTAFDWGLISGVRRDYFLAGGLSCENVTEAVRTLRPWAVDVSSGIETDGQKDKNKMAAFIAAVRKEDAQ
jgi:phosphoribosylanthranilate isomerase